MTRREYRSRITAKYSQPPLVQMSPAHFWLGAISRDVLIQQIGRNVERVIAVGRHPPTGRVFVECPRGLVFLGSDDLDAILSHQTANATVPDIQVQFL